MVANPWSLPLVQMQTYLEALFVLKRRSCVERQVEVLAADHELEWSMDDGMGMSRLSLLYAL